MHMLSICVAFVDKRIESLKLKPHTIPGIPGDGITKILQANLVSKYTF